MNGVRKQFSLKCVSPDGIDMRQSMRIKQAIRRDGRVLILAITGAPPVIWNQKAHHR